MRPSFKFFSRVFILAIVALIGFAYQQYSGTVAALFGGNDTQYTSRSSRKSDDSGGGGIAPVGGNIGTVGGIGEVGNKNSDSTKNSGAFN